MPIDVKGPDGVVTRFPDGTPDARIGVVMAGIYGKQKTRDGVREGQRQQMRRNPLLGIGDRFNDAATLGLGDEIAGVASAGSNALLGGIGSGLRAIGVDNGLPEFAPVEAFQRGRQEFKDDTAKAKREMPVASGVADVAGLVSSIGTAPARAAVGGLASAVRTGARQGAIMGGISGAAGSDGNLVERAAAGAVGAGIGGTLGAALPVAGRMISNTVQGAQRLTGRGGTVAPSVVADALRADGGIRRASTMVDDAQARGVPLALGDTGDNARAILASTGRQPGEARTIVRDMAIGRQEGQADRIASAIGRDLGPVANPRAVSEALQQEAKAAAAPLYAEAYAAPTPITDNLAAILKRIPRAAVDNAKRVAKLEGRDPNTLGVAFDEAGDIVLVGKPSVETLDYIKRGLDDVVEKSRDKTTGRLALDGEGRVTNNLLREFVAEIDRVNPAYAKARAAYAGPVRAAAALNKGGSFANKTADDILAETRDLTPYELEQYRLGVRSAMTRLIESKGDYANKINAIVGTPKKRATLARIFGGAGEFDRFMATLADEGRAAQTYASVAGNSLTAERQAFDGATGDQGLIDIATNAAVTGGMGSPVRAITQALADLKNYGAGEAGKRTRAEVAAALSETDPAILRQALRDAQRSMARDRLANRRGAAAAVPQGRVAGVVAGQGVNALARRPE
jgi:hypothetical protein